jgi:hypothetical protein
MAIDSYPVLQGLDGVPRLMAERYADPVTA